MKVLLLSPYLDSHYNVPPISLGYVAKGLLMEGFSVKIVDGVKEKLSHSSFGKVIEDYKPDVIGIQVYSCSVGIAKGYVAYLKRNYPSIIIVLGGPHVSGVKAEIFKDFTDVKYAFQGEADTSFPLFLKRAEAKASFNDINGLIWNDNGKIKENPPSFEEDLDKIGAPAWGLMDPRKYKGAPQGAVFRNTPIAPILTSRGCPFHCTFCANYITHGRKVRLRSIENVVGEIELLQKAYGVKEIHIIDDNFASSKERVLEFCNEVSKRGLKFTLTFPNGIRLNSLDKEVLLKLKEIGCYSIIVGIESGSQKILNDMKKGLTIELIKEKVSLISSMGIDVTGFFIIGYPTETKGDIEETIKFAKELNLKRAHFSLFLPLPGTEITEQLKKEGKLKNLDWSKLSYTNAIIPPEGITADELKKLQKKAFHSFYLRPKIIYHMVKEVNSVSQFKMLIKRAIDYGFGREK